MNTKQLCERALESVRYHLTDSEYVERHDLSYHGERPLTLEFAIDFMDKREETIDEVAFALFEAAFV